MTVLIIALAIIIALWLLNAFLPEDFSARASGRAGAPPPKPKKDE